MRAVDQWLHGPWLSGVRGVLNDSTAHGQASARYIEYILEKEGDISAGIAEPVLA